MELEHLILEHAQPLRQDGWLSYTICFPDGSHYTQEGSVIEIGKGGKKYEGNRNS